MKIRQIKRSLYSKGNVDCFLRLHIELARLERLPDADRLPFGADDVFEDGLCEQFFSHVIAPIERHFRCETVCTWQAETDDSPWIDVTLMPNPRSASYASGLADLRGVVPKILELLNGLSCVVRIDAGLERWDDSLLPEPVWLKVCTETLAKVHVSTELSYSTSLDRAENGMVIEECQVGLPTRFAERPGKDGPESVGDAVQ